jgi:hypothetical protein
MAINDIVNNNNTIQNFINQNNSLLSGQDSNLNQSGFALPASYASDGSNLPYSQVPDNKSATIKRNIITWFVPQFGTVRMFINPSSIGYAYKKLIQKDRTKGGFTLQYWGEDLITLNISGTTGSSGVEGINVLYEIYRAEQYAFDAVGLSINASNASAGLASNIVNAAGSGLDSLTGAPLGSGAGILNDVFGLDSPANTLAINNLPSLAQLAFSVEMYYDGWVYRGFFENISFTESASNFAWEYQITFTATQRRGYRANYFPFHKSARNGPSDPNTPYSINGNKVTTG